MKNNNNYRSNGGFTILELLIVITIGLIMLTFIGITLGAVRGANVNAAARALKNSASHARSQSMAKGKDAGMLRIWIDGNSVYCRVGDDGDKKELCNLKEVNVNKVAFETTTKTATVVNPLVEVGEANEVTVAFTNMGTVNKTDSSLYPFNAIQFNRETRNTYVVIYPETGNIEVITQTY